jgi:GAF domain-containing protein
MNTQNMQSDSDNASWLDLLLHHDYEPEDGLDCITREAATLLHVPIVLISLLASDHVVFKSAVGFDKTTKLDRSGSFCAAAAAQDKPFIVSDTLQHEFFKDHFLVTGKDAIRSYAGKSLHGPDGTRIGSLCLLDTKPRTFSLTQRRAITELAKSAEQQLQALLDPASGAHGYSAEPTPSFA